MRQRLAPVVASLMILAACGDSGSNTNQSPTTTGGVETTLSASAEQPTTSIDGDVDPVTAGQLIEDMVVEANADGEMTAAELSEILSASTGMPKAQADCQGQLLADLGLTDPTDVSAYQEAGDSLTNEQLLELAKCMGLATG